MMFSKLKALLRRAEERSVVTLWEHIGTCLDHVTDPNAQTTSKPQAMRQHERILL
jgi:hypothetical protein